jgi:hypothetical protein
LSPYTNMFTFWGVGKLQIHIRKCHYLLNHILVFWDVIMCRFRDGYGRFRGIYYHAEDGSSMFIRKVGIGLQGYAVSHWAPTTYQNVYSLLKYLNILKSGLFLGDKVAGAWSWPLTSNYCRGKENTDICIHSAMRLHGVVLSQLSTAATFYLLLYISV